MRSKYSDKDLRDRLEGTVCRYNEHPYYVAYGGGQTLLLSDMKNPGNKTLYKIVGSDPDLDISTIPLGYVQLNNTRVLYVERKPHRRFKQGVDPDSVRYSTIDGKSGHEAGHVIHDLSFYSASVENMILDLYPNLDAVLSTKLDRDTEVAISREVALKYRKDLDMWEVYLQKEVVGYIPPGGSRTVIVPNNEMGWVVSLKLGMFSWEVQ